MSTTPLIEALFNGLSNSSILILTALGLSITFGVMRVINMAHGEMLMLGAYTGFVVTHEDGLPRLLTGLWKLLFLNKVFGHDLDVTRHRGLPEMASELWKSIGLEGVFGHDVHGHLIPGPLTLNIFVAIPIAFVTVGLVGYVLEKTLIRFLYGRPLDTLLATWGVGLVLQQVVRLVFGPDLKPLRQPAILQGSGEFFTHYSYYWLALVVSVCLITLLVLYCLFAIASALARRLGIQKNLSVALGLSGRQAKWLRFGITSVLAILVGVVVARQLITTPEQITLKNVPSLVALLGTPQGQGVIAATSYGLPPTVIMSFPYFRVFIVGFTCLALALVYLGFFRTRFGLQVRAVTQNRAMASSLGIRTPRIDAWTFALGSGLAGVAGCIFGNLFPVIPDMGQGYIVFAFVVVILGGMGRLLGTVLAGVVVGTADSLLTKLFGNDFGHWYPQLHLHWWIFNWDLELELFPKWIVEVNQPMARVAVLLMVIGFIMVRPAGLLALKERVYD